MLLKNKSVLYVFSCLFMFGCKNSDGPKTQSFSFSEEQISGFEDALNEAIQLDWNSTQPIDEHLTMAVAVYGPNGETWRSGKGLVNFETGEQYDKTQHFRIGSITKSYVAATILRLAEEGLLSLDTTASSYYADLPEEGELITIQMLLNHTAGLASYTSNNGFMSTLQQAPETEWTPEELLGFATELGLNFTPGTSREYSNSNYILLGYIIEQVTGTPVSEAIRTYVLDPLDLDSTYYDVEEPPIGQLAHGYEKGLLTLNQVEDWTYQLSPTATWASGAMVSTPEDIAQWSCLYWSNELLQDNTMTEVQKLVDITGEPTDLETINSAPIGSDAAMGFGLGFGVDKSFAGRMRHLWSGYVFGYISNVAYDPEHNVCVSYIVNGGQFYFGSNDVDGDGLSGLFDADEQSGWDYLYDEVINIIGQ